MMSKDEIQKINEWFDKDDEDRSLDTHRSDRCYCVHSWDIEAFTDFLTEEFPDLIGIECMVGNNGIWFWDSSLEKARFI